MTHSRWQGIACLVLLTASPLLAVQPIDAPAPANLPLAACMAPDTSPERVREIAEQLMGLEPATALHPPADGFVFNDGDRWDSTATDAGPLGQGDPTTLTWSIVPDGTFIPSGIGEPSGPSDLEAWLDGIYGSSAVWQPLLEGVFDRWAELTGITYVYEPNDDGADLNGSNDGVLGVRGDIRIAGHFLDGNSGVLAYNYFPAFGGDMVLDSDDNFYDNTTSDSIRLRNIVSHENGHGIGLMHVCPDDGTKLMEPFINTNFDGPQFDDILAGNRGYGDVSEGNDSSGSATDLGFLAAGGSTTVTDQSIDDNADSDFYSFDVGSDQQATVTVTPLGFTYNSGEQGFFGCGSGTPFDALNIHDLSIELLDSDGSTVLASADVNGTGGSETVVDVPLSSGAGTYFVRAAGDSSNEAQLYEVSVSVEDVGVSTFTLLSPDPGVADQDNTFTVTGATPGETTFFVGGLSSGSTAIPGCPGNVDIDGVIVLGSAIADGSGTAELTIFVPGSASGATALLQAVEQSTCLVSNLVTETF